MRAAIYARVSTTEQAERGYSIDTQLSACRAAVDADSVEEFIDSGSGEFLERPAMDALRAKLKQKAFDVVICYDPDRLARNLAHQLIITDEIEKSGAELKFVSVTFERSPEGKLFYSIRGAISSFEKEKIRERTMRGMRGKIAKGKLYGRRDTFGYDWDAEKSNYIINEEQAKVVRLIFKLLIEDELGLRRIAVYLNNNDIKPPKGKMWASSTVHKIVQNESYAGTHWAFQRLYTMEASKKRKYTRRPQEEWAAVPTPAIITKEQFDQAHQQLKRNRELNKGNMTREHVFRPLLYCGKCGRKLYIFHVEARMYYGCGRKQDLSSYCKARCIPIQKIESQLWERIKEMKPEDLPVLADDSAERIKLLNNQEKELLSQQEALTRILEKKLLKPDRLLSIEKQLTEIDESMKQIASARANIKPRKRKTAKEIMAVLKKLGEYSLDKQPAILSVIEKIFLERTDTGRKSLEVNTNIVWR
jgi:site-specific DNA recombinase